ncbi:unnamed protein product [Absidia cylindrospora]
MVDKEMLGGVQLEDDIWANCVGIILDLIEDSLVDDENTRSRRPNHIHKQNEKEKSVQASKLLTVATQPSTESLKRKRSFSEGLEDRKLKKLSDNLANDIARSLSVADSSMDCAESRRSPAMPSSSYFNHAFGSSLLPTPIPRISTSFNSITNSTTPLHENWKSIPPSVPSAHLTVKFDQQMQQQAQLLGMSIDDYKVYFDKLWCQSRHTINQLQHMVHQDYSTFDQIKTCLQTFVLLSKELTGDHYSLFLDMFPEWRTWDTFIQKIANYVQCVDDMQTLVDQPVKTSNDIQQYIKDLNQLVDSRSSLYGDFLIHNGLEWKAMGLPISGELLNTVKHWFLRVCLSLLGELDMVCSSIQQQVSVNDDWNIYSDGDEQMEYLLEGMEVIGRILTFIGTTNKRINSHCHLLATVYGQWVSEYLEYLNQEQTGYRMAMIKKLSQNNHNGKSSGRTDLRLMQQMGSMVRLLNTLLVVQDLDNVNGMMDHGDVQEGPGLDDINLETTTDMLVEITVRAIAVIETHRSLHCHDIKGATNIMSRPLQSSYIYMEESLLSFADKVVELSGREWIDGSKVQRLHLLLEDMELSFNED